MFAANCKALQPTVFLTCPPFLSEVASSLGAPCVRFSETIPARFEPETIEAIGKWAEKHNVSRSEAIRRLVEIGLKAKK